MILGKGHKNSNNLQTEFPLKSKTVAYTETAHLHTQLSPIL